MAGGTWLSQNKIRPGAYINFKSVPSPLLVVGDRGIATIAMPLSWGANDKLIEVLSTDLLDGTSRKLVGFTAFDTAESKLLRLILQSCYKVLVFRQNVSGVKATASATAFTVTAKYFGTLGNKLTIQVAQNDSTGKYVATTFLNGLAVDQQENLTSATQLVSNDFVDFTPTSSPTLTEIAGLPLTSGTDGTVSAASAYPTYFNLAKTARWQCMAVCDNHSVVNPLVTTFVRTLREDEGRKVQVATYNYSNADYEGVISYSQGYKTPLEDISAEEFPAVMAGFTAGANIVTSNTNRIIPDAISIINPLTDSEIKQALKSGQGCLSTRQDGTIKIEQDINTFTSFTQGKNYTFSKNRAIRVMDEIAITMLDTWEKSYAGYVTNGSLERDVFKGDLVNYIQELQRIRAVDNLYDPDENIEVARGTNIDAVLATIFNLPILDSMEKLYMDVYIK